MKQRNDDTLKDFMFYLLEVFGMTAKEYLEQGLIIEKLIAENMKALQYWREKSMMVSGSNFEPKYNATRNTTANFVPCVENIICYEENVKRGIDRLYALKDEIYTSIQQVSDPRERLLLMNRYVNCYSWPEVCSLMGISERTVRRVHREALQKFKVPVLN